MKVPLSSLAAVSLASAVLAGPAAAYTRTAQTSQAESFNANGRLVAEQSVIHTVQCNASGENGRAIYVYQYLKRPGFRAIDPPNWGSPIGGHDFATFNDAASVGCAAAAAPPRPPLAGLWTWRQVGTADCAGNDAGQSDGSQPQDSHSKAGYTAICWDGRQFNNSYTRSGQAFCTYKSVPATSCKGGTNLGVAYQAVQR